jgi:small-conductance mechanosensitive channel
VKRIGIRASTVRTWSGAEVIVPNGDLISQQVTNWTLSDRLRRMEVAVGVKYGTDPQRVIDLLLETVTRHPDVLDDPEPVALFQGFGASSLDFVVRAWTAGESWWTVNSDLTVAVNNALKEADIEIPFPQRDLHLRTVSPEVKLKE